MQKTIFLSLTLGALLASGLPAANKVDARRENQQDRIAQGVKSGELTAGETARLEKRETRINREVHADRKANGGHLTAQEKKHVNNQQDRTSRQIYRQKHDGQTQPK